MIFMKPKLLIEIEYQGKDNVDLTSEDENPLERTQRDCWNVLR